MNARYFKDTMTPMANPDWKKVAEACQLAIPTDAAVVTLNALEIVFRPLPATLQPEDDLGVVFQASL